MYIILGELKIINAIVYNVLCKSRSTVVIFIANNFKSNIDTKKCRTSENKTIIFAEQENIFTE